MWYSGNTQCVMYILCVLETCVNEGLWVVNHYFGIVINPVLVDCKERYLTEVISASLLPFLSMQSITL